MGNLNLRLPGPRSIPVDCVVRRFAGLTDILAWYTGWFPHMFDLAGNRLYPDSHWRVDALWEEYHNAGYDVRVLDICGEIQGYFISSGKHAETEGMQCTYIHFLASAPWNRKDSTHSERRFSHIGQILIASACIYGLSRIGTPVIELHSVKKAEPFYEKIGFKKTGQLKDTMNEYRLESQQAFDLIRFMKPFLVR